VPAQEARAAAVRDGVSVSLPEAEMKGSAFHAMVVGLRAVAGEEKWARVLAGLSPDARLWCTRDILSTEWVPIRIPQELRRKAFELAFHKQLPKSFEAGVAAFREQNSRIFRIAFRLLSKEFVMGKLAMVWHGSYKNHGTVSLVSSSPKHAEIAFADVPSGSQLYWTTKAGVLFAAAETVGGRDIQSRVLSMTPDFRGAVIRADWK
jgi:hypothetical protein